MTPTPKAKPQTPPAAAAVAAPAARIGPGRPRKDAPPRPPAPPSRKRGRPRRPETKNLAVRIPIELAWEVQDAADNAKTTVSKFLADLIASWWTQRHATPNGP